MRIFSQRVEKDGKGTVVLLPEDAEVRRVLAALFFMRGSTSLSVSSRLISSHLISSHRFPSDRISLYDTPCRRSAPPPLHDRRTCGTCTTSSSLETG